MISNRRKGGCNPAAILFFVFNALILSARTDIPDSAGYVAMERVKGKLHGRKGSFVLQHTGKMNRGKPSLLVTVVPDSGTGELSGLTGTLSINIVDRKHYYEFTYELPEMDS